MLKTSSKVYQDSRNVLLIAISRVPMYRSSTTYKDRKYNFPTGHEDKQV